MFRMDNSTLEILEGDSPNKRQLAAQKRQKVYKYIMEHPDTGTNTELARAAGYNMGVIGSDEYNAGANFISNLIRQGYIVKENTHGMTCFYIGDKEPVEPTAPVKTTPLDEAKQILEDDEDEECMGPEGQSAEDWENDDPITYSFDCEFLKTYNGRIEISDRKNPDNKITVEFSNKSHCDIANLIENLNMEDLI